MRRNWAIRAEIEQLRAEAEGRAQPQADTPLRGRPQPQDEDSFGLPFSVHRVWDTLDAVTFGIWSHAVVDHITEADGRVEIRAFLMAITLLGFLLAAAPTCWGRELPLAKYCKYSLLYDGIQFACGAYLTFALNEQGTVLPLSVNCINFVTTFIDVALLKGPKWVKETMTSAVDARLAPE